MSRRAPFLVCTLLLGGCGGGDGGSDTSPTPGAKPVKDDAGCAEAKRTIADIPKPQDTDGMADYADQAADALEKVQSPAVQPLRDAELASVEIRVRLIDRAVRELQQAQGACGEAEAARVLTPMAYSLGLDDALAAHKRDSRGAPPRSQLGRGLRFDARNSRALARRLEALVVPEQLRADHDRFVSASRRYADELDRAARNPTDPVMAALQPHDTRQERALRRLDTALRRLLKR